MGRPSQAGTQVGLYGEDVIHSTQPIGPLQGFTGSPRMPDSHTPLNFPFFILHQPHRTGVLLPLPHIRETASGRPFQPSLCGCFPAVSLPAFSPPCVLGLCL